MATWKKLLIAFILLAIVVGAVLGGILGSRASDDNKDSSSSNANQDSDNKSTGPTASNKSVGGSATNANGATSVPVATGATAVAQAAIAIGRYATATDAYFVPVYPTSTQLAGYVAPTALPTNLFEGLSNCSNTDTFTPGTDSAGNVNVRDEHPRLFGTAADWACLPNRIANDAYLTSWNDTIMANATRYLGMDVQPYTIDGDPNGPTGGLGDSGILDPAREIQQRIKHWAYAWRMTRDTKWSDRAWLELQTAVGNNSAYGSWGPAPDNHWNKIHLLDLAELTLAYAIGYDWMYDAWTDDQRASLVNAIQVNGLQYGLAAYVGGSDPSAFGYRSDAGAYSWWTTVQGNWNCVPAGGMAAGSLAIWHEDTTGMSQALLSKVIPNAIGNCNRLAEDGSWPETSDYNYFGMTGHSNLAAVLRSATGDTQGVMGTGSPSIWGLNAEYHMYVFGMTSKFQYGDHGPNKYTATANGLMNYGRILNNPLYTLYQRDRSDAAEPFSMLYYNETHVGAWWNGLAFDRWFSSANESWASMRSSWTSNDGVYLAMRAALSTHHATHQDLDVGTFVLDAMGERWAGELGSGNYLAQNYFSNETQESERWYYYRKRTEGQNTFNIIGKNQVVDVIPTVKFDSTKEVQNASTSTSFDASTAAYFWSDNTVSYTDATSIKRGTRIFNKRRQVLVQDEVSTSADGQWRMHTNATVNINSDGTTATLTLNKKTLLVELSSATGNAKFGTEEAVRLQSDPGLDTSNPLDVDQPNPGVTVLTINVAAGTETLYVTFSPQWDGDKTSSMSAAKVPLENWSLTSHV